MLWGGQRRSGGGGGASARALREKVPDGSAMSYCRQEGAPECPPNVTPPGQAGRAGPEAAGGGCEAGRLPARLSPGREGAA